MTYSVSSHDIQQFTANFELLVQQRDHRHAGTYTTDSYTGEAGQAIKQFGEFEFEEKKTLFEDTNLSEIDHHQRWVFPIDFTGALPIARESEMRQIGELQSPYVIAMSAGWNRKKDEVFTAAFDGDARTGKHGSVTTSFLASQSIAVDYVASGSAADSGLTISKLIRAKEILDANEADEMEGRFFSHTAQQMSDLLETTQVTSADYNTVKALVRGEIDTFLGFRFIRYEKHGDNGVASPNTDRKNFAWCRSGMHMGIWRDREVRIAERPDKNHLTQVWMAGHIGSTRMQEKKVVRVWCRERATS